MTKISAKELQERIPQFLKNAARDAPVKLYQFGPNKGEARRTKAFTLPTGKIMVDYEMGYHGSNMYDSGE